MYEKKGEFWEVKENSVPLKKQHSPWQFFVLITTIVLTFIRFFGVFPSSGILENTTFRKLDLIPPSGEDGGEDTYSVGPLKKS
jgi:hypothetical protein